MKNAPLISIGILGLALVGVFWWGFAGFVAAGSGGPPPKAQGYAFWVGGIGYLVLLLFVAAPGTSPNSMFVRSAKKNLKWTSIWLLACFPAAVFFIGFIAPPFILAWSAFALLASAFARQEMSDEH